MKLALRCYPTWWRERYGDEVRVHAVDMVADGYPPILLTQSFLWGAIRLRMTARGMPKEYGLWARRTSLAIATAVVPLFVAIPILSQSTGGIQINLERTLPSGQAAATRDLNAIALAMLILLLVSVVVVVMGWAELRRGLRRTDASARLRSLVWVPLFAAMADIALAVPLMKINQWEPVKGHPAATHALATAGATVFWLGLVMSITSILVVASRSHLQSSDLAKGLRIATVAAIVIAGNLAAYCLRGSVLLGEPHPAVHGVSQPALWAPTVLLISLALVVSVWASLAARRSWRVLATKLPLSGALEG